MKKYSKEWFKNQEAKQDAKHEGFDLVMIIAVSLIILVMIFGE